MNIEDLSRTQRRHIAAIINTYGTGDHPFASEDSIEYFQLEYVEELLQVAWDKNPHEDRRRIITEIKEELGI